MKLILPLVLMTFVVLAGCTPSSPVSQKPVFADQSACVAAGGEWVEQPFEGFYRCRMADERQCAAYGGDWMQQGLLGEMSCVFTYHDAGKECSSSQECLGGCVIENPEQQTGTCKETDSPFGCWTFMNGPAMCVD